MSLSTNADLLSVTMQLHQDPLKLSVEFTLAAPWTVLFGASGSGKTTVLRTIAGFIQPTQGRIVLAGRPVFNHETRLSLPSHRRAVRSAGQSARLFPGMTVRENLRYGMVIEDRQLEDEILHLFRIQQLAEKLPKALSGGEQQRVSVARAAGSAVAGRAQLLLLDEPFAGLDLSLRDALAVELRDWLRERQVPVLSVTHDISEAFLLRAEVIRLVNGKIADQGPVERVLAAERQLLLHQLQA